MSAGIYEEVEIEDMTYDPETLTYSYPCPCGDKFSIELEELYDEEDIALCPSCTLRIRVIFDVDSLPELPDEEEEEEDEAEVNATENDIKSLSMKEKEVDIVAKSNVANQMVNTVFKVAESEAETPVDDKVLLPQKQELDNSET